MNEVSDVQGAMEGDLLETFNKIFGAYFYYRDEKVPDLVKNWDIAKLPVDREARHTDKTLHMEFYRQLDLFLGKRKCTLVY